MSETSPQIKIGVSNTELEDQTNMSAVHIEDMEKIINIDGVRNNGVKYH